MITGKYEFDEILNQEVIDYLGNGEKEKLHLGYGAGIHFALNENFVVAFDRGYAANIRDGDKGLYIGLNFLY